MAKKPDVPCAGGCGELLWRSKTSATQPTCHGCRRSRRSQQPRRTALTPRLCVGCGAEFTPRMEPQRRCRKGCGKCNGRALRPCEICQQEYKPSHGTQRTCSRACGTRLRKDITLTMRVWWPGCAVSFPDCAACGGTFTSRRGRKYCTEECASKAHLEQSKAWTKERYRTDPAFRDHVIATAQARRASRLGVGDLYVTLAYLADRDHGRCGICRKTVRAKRGPMGPSIDHIIPLSLGGRHELVNVQLAHLRCNLRKHNSGTGDQLLLFG